MKRKQTARRIFSGLLAAGVCAGMAAPVAYADEALPLAEPAAEEAAAQLPDDTIELPEDAIPAEDAPEEEAAPTEEQHEDAPVTETADVTPEAAPETAEDETPAGEEVSTQAQPQDEAAVVDVQDASETQDADTAETPTLTFSEGDTWTPVAGESKKVVLSGGTSAVDNYKLTLTGSEADAADRYTLNEDGSISLKEGKQAVNGETLTVKADVSYYGKDQLLLNNPIEADSDLSPSNSLKGYQITEAKSHTGTKAATTNGTKGTNGAYIAKNLGSKTGTLVFWYYDPCTEEETDPAKALAAFGSNDLDQYKFGVCINDYAPFFLGAAVPAKGDTLTIGQNPSMQKRLEEYSRTYTCRVAGTWYATNIERTPGWHKMEVAVTASGSTAKIDGTDVCKKGETTPITAEKVTSINHVFLATNWADKAGTLRWIQDRHFVDDAYIIKPDAGDAATAELTATVTIETANAEADAATVDAAKTAIEAMGELTVPQADAADEAAVQALVEAKLQALDLDVTAVVNKVSYTAAVAGSPANENGTDGVYTYTVTLTKNAATATTAEGKVNIAAPQYIKPTFELVYDDGTNDTLERGTDGRVYLENMEDYAVASVNYSTNNENVTVDMDGTLHIKAGYTPKAGETVTVTADVNYYDPAGVVFTDSFEGDKLFTVASNTYSQSDAGSLFGRKAATLSGTYGYAKKNFAEAQTDVTVTAWYYDTNEVAGQIKFGFGINGDSSDAIGIFYDDSIAAYVDGMTKTHYGLRTPDVTVQQNSYAWGSSNAERSKGWHKFEWVITDNGTTEKIDGKIIFTNPYVGKNMTDEQQKLSKELKDCSTKSLSNLTLLCQWANNPTNLAAVQDRHFIDGVSVVKNGTATIAETLTSGAIKLADVTYTVSPDSISVDSTYPQDASISIAPYLEGDTDIASVAIDGNVLPAEQWTAAMSTAPDNASNYPADLEGYRLTVKAAAFAGLADGSHTMTLTLTNGRELTVTVTAAASTHVATDYYLSQDGNDSNDGHTAATAWKSFDKLSQVTFGPGDHIYLDAHSTWSGVQFQPQGSGAPGNPIVLTKYNDGGDSSLRPILNGDGTVADFSKHSYLAFDAWRAFYPSGTIELFNVDNWEVRGIEVTNYEGQLTRGATGRNGIAIIYDYLEAQGYTTLPSGNAALEQAFYNAGKLQHVVVDDCYIHDVVGFHPDNGAVGRGGKMSGGINAYGPYDDLQLNNNIVMYCDVEGIRNDVLAWMGDTTTQFPAYMENVSISNNYIVGVPGDGVVISSANKPILENNYLTDAGYSYHATSNASTAASSGWNASSITSCKQVTEPTGTKAKEMGDRSKPTVMRSTNFAGLWFIGTKDAVAQYNEAVNNVWTCNDAEAFDTDMYCWGTIFQYNYTYRNNGGFCLFMGSMCDGTVVRYNISVEDAQSVGIGESQNGTFHYNGTPEAIHNNLFILGDNVATMFGGDSNTTYFYNNIVIAPNGLIAEDKTSFNGYHLNGSSDNKILNPALKGEVKNNIFYPAKIVDSIVDGSSVTLENNIVLNSDEEMKALFKDLDAFMDAQPVKALAGRSDFAGSITVSGTDTNNKPTTKGAGVAMTDAEARKVKTPTGGFDLNVFDGVKLADGSAAIGKGLAVADMHSYNYKAQNEAANPLQQDFYRNDISNMTTVDIGPHQYSTEKAAIQPDPEPKPEPTPDTTPAGSNNNSAASSKNTSATGSQNKAAADASAAKPAAQAAIVPQTGDSQPIALYMVLAIVAALGFAGVYVCKKRQQ